MTLFFTFAVLLCVDLLALLVITCLFVEKNLIESTATKGKRILLHCQISLVPLAILLAAGTIVSGVLSFRPDTPPLPVSPETEAVEESAERDTFPAKETTSADTEEFAGEIETKPNQASSDSSKTDSESGPSKPNPTEPKPTNPKPTEPKPTEPKPTNPKPTDPKPTEPKPTEPRPTEPPESTVSPPRPTEPPESPDSPDKPNDSGSGEAPGGDRPEWAPPTDPGDW